MQKDNNFFQDEIEKFDKIADSWWDLEGEFKALHSINPLRLEFIKENIDLSEKKVLDIGCGGGILSEALYLSGADVTGIDLSSDAIKIASHHAKITDKKIHYQKISAEKFSELFSENYDIITCMELIEHVPDPQSVIESCSKLLKKGGVLFLSTLNKNITSYLQAIVIAEYILKLIPKNTHDFNKFITPTQLYKMCLNNNLEVKKISGFTYNLFSKLYYRCNTAKVNYLVFAQKTY